MTDIKPPQEMTDEELHEYIPVELSRLDANSKALQQQYQSLTNYQAELAARICPYTVGEFVELRGRSRAKYAKVIAVTPYQGELQPHESTLDRWTVVLQGLKKDGQLSEVTWKANEDNILGCYTPEVQP